MWNARHLKDSEGTQLTDGRGRTADVDVRSLDGSGPLGGSRGRATRDFFSRGICGLDASPFHSSWILVTHLAYSTTKEAKRI